MPNLEKIPYWNESETDARSRFGASFGTFTPMMLKFDFPFSMPIA